MICLAELLELVELLLQISKLLEKGWREGPQHCRTALKVLLLEELRWLLLLCQVLALRLWLRQHLICLILQLCLLLLPLYLLLHLLPRLLCQAV